MESVRHHKSRYALVIVVLAMFATLSPISPMASTPAEALQYDCVNGLFCSWKNASFTGTRLSTNADLNALDPYGFNDNISSAFNRNSATFALHQHVDCDGIKQVFSPSVADSQVTRNDDASSINDYAQGTCWG